MMSYPRIYLKEAIAYTCAIAFLFLCSACSVLAQEAATSSTEIPSSVTGSTGYTTEFITSVDGTVPGDFVVGPGKTELRVDPGTSQIVEIIVTNRTGGTREFQLEVEDATGSSDPDVAVVLLGDDTGPYTLRDYISLPVETFSLEHNERARIPVRVSVPPDAEPGGRYGSVLVTTVSNEASLEAIDGATPSSAVISRIGTLFFLTIPGETRVEGSLQSIATIPDTKFFSHGPINFQILFENTGALHLNPYGEIRIHNIFNEEVGFVELDPWFAMPQSLRSREIAWNRELLIGKYTATAHINRGYDNIVDTKSVTFWVLPWQIIVPVFLGLFLLFFLVRYAVTHFEFKRKAN